MQKRVTRRSRVASPGRPSHRGLNRELVLSAAVALADREGLGAVTMRALALKLGVEAMSIYNHLPGKDGLLDGLVERVVSEIIADTAGRSPRLGWRAAIRQRCLAARAVMLRHPWAPPLLASRTAIPSSAYLYYEGILATLVGGGFSYHLAHRALHALGSMALGFVSELFAPSSASSGESDSAASKLAAFAQTFPHLAAMVASEVHAHDGDTLGWCDSQAEFEFTLDLLLDGLDRHARKRRRPRTPRPSLG